MATISIPSSFATYSNCETDKRIIVTRWKSVGSGSHSGATCQSRAHLRVHGATYRYLSRINDNDTKPRWRTDWFHARNSETCRRFIASTSRSLCSRVNSLHSRRRWRLRLRRRRRRRRRTKQKKEEEEDKKKKKKKSVCVCIHTVGFGQGKSTRMNAVRGFHPPSRRYKFSLSILGIGNLLMPREGKVSLRRSPSARGGECEEEGNRDRVGLVSVKRFRSFVTCCYLRAIFYWFVLSPILLFFEYSLMSAIS